MASVVSSTLVTKAASALDSTNRSFSTTIISSRRHTVSCNAPKGRLSLLGIDYDSDSDDWSRLALSSLRTGEFSRSSHSLWENHGKLVAASRGRRISAAAQTSCRAVRAALDALIFDCDGVILESEDLHRQAYNLTFEHFDLKCAAGPVIWDTVYYDRLQNTIGGGKPKMRWHFGQNGWPSSTIFGTPPESEDDQGTLIDTLQDWKTSKYKDLISSGAEPRPGVLELMDEAKAQGLKVAVCSAATKSSVVFCLVNLLGKKRFEQLDCFLAGDDVENKKPDPSIYRVAAVKMGADPRRCLVVEDSVIGLQAALGAGMNCIITYTSSSAKQDFSCATAIYPNLEGVGLKDLVPVLEIAA